MQAVERPRHSVPRQRKDVIGARLLEKLSHVGSLDRVAVEARFEALQAEGGKHQQPWDEANQQPRHKQVVNTSKVSVGSRIVTGPQYQMSAVSVRLQS